ncbi:MAG: peptidoglycan DD-metalloendopeptidase family protein [Rhodocyclaceae bacterium]|nr:peptidoglycan DD-metalloendopeptidase family protein [Rhodocyclaceae bacterium]MCW5614733.1 peptidoglycan DD-metalloendopeptidase family protein [Rhodocyclaceae bacterium]
MLMLLPTKLRHLAVAFLATLLPGLAPALTPQPVPGGIVRIALGAEAAARPQARFGDQPVLVYRENGEWQALVGIPLETKPGLHPLIVSDEQGRLETMDIEIRDKRYPVQHLVVRNKRHVDPDPEDLARWEREKRLQDDAKLIWRAIETGPPALALPVRGRRSSAFGLRRTFNGEPRAPHRGLDIAVPRGTPVAAPAAGEVTLTGDYFFNGKTVFIDHGQGLISMLCHLDSIGVHTGEIVKTGQAIGRAGATGRATGPHVHWSVFLNGTAVDPSLLLPGP